MKQPTFRVNGKKSRVTITYLVRIFIIYFEMRIVIVISTIKGILLQHHNDCRVHMGLYIYEPFRISIQVNMQRCVSLLRIVPHGGSRVNVIPSATLWTIKHGSLYFRLPVILSKYQVHPSMCLLAENVHTMK